MIFLKKNINNKKKMMLFTQIFKKILFQIQHKNKLFSLHFLFLYYSVIKIIHKSLKMISFHFVIINQKNKFIKIRTKIQIKKIHNKFLQIIRIIDKCAENNNIQILTMKLIKYLNEKKKHKIN